MRPINVTLCSTTWELAKQKVNFSCWVREKLSEEFRIAREKEESRQLYGAYCKTCDFTANHPEYFMMQTYYCRYCHAKTEYLGAI